MVELDNGAVYLFRKMEKWVFWVLKVFEYVDEFVSN